MSHTDIWPLGKTVSINIFLNIFPIFIQKKKNQVSMDLYRQMPLIEGPIKFFFPKFTNLLVKKPNISVRHIFFFFSFLKNREILAFPAMFSSRWGTNLKPDWAKKQKTNLDFVYHGILKSKEPPQTFVPKILASLYPKWANCKGLLEPKSVN